MIATFNMWGMICMKLPCVNASYNKDFEKLGFVCLGWTEILGIPKPSKSNLKPVCELNKGRNEGFIFKDIKEKDIYWLQWIHTTNDLYKLKLNPTLSKPLFPITVPWNYKGETYD